MHTTTIYHILLGYLNIVGIALVSAFLIVLGLRLAFPHHVPLKGRSVLGVMLILIAILLIFRFMCRFSAGIIH